MSVSNHERIGRALELLRAGLLPYVRREMEHRYGKGWVERALASLRHEPGWGEQKGEPYLDAHALLVLMWEQWTEVFGLTLGHAERALVSELREVRNRWAHQGVFTADDTYRALDSVARLLTAISAEEARKVDRMKQEFLRLRFEEEARRQAKQVGLAPTAGEPLPGLKPWRAVATPHPDVASGRYRQAEFAADLAQVHRGEGEPEYRDPKEFFRRTFLTEGLRGLLTNALKRLAGDPKDTGDPVLELQTNFGGGKTHSMLALYHLFSGYPVSDLPGVEAALAGVATGKLPPVRRAVLVGTDLSPAKPRERPDGTVTRTLWGDLAWQIGGPEGYRLVAEADAAGVSPGAEALTELFRKFGPCLVLMDELVAYVRQLYTVTGLPGGSFDANLTFVQALTEAARRAAGTVVVAAIPSSNIEVGGEGGREALSRLSNTFSRIKAGWQPATTEEGFEIVRRRLFQPIESSAAFADRDAVVSAFGKAYRQHPEEYPPECHEAAYENRLRAAYPVHPELFDRLYEAWSSLDKFQRTRGVLRLMAAVIHSLWERNDSSLMILPGTVPVDDPAVQSELTRYLDDPWRVVIEKDVDGPASAPLDLDREVPNLGRYSASRRVARTIYLGSAPTLGTANPGIDERAVKLGCVQPGENPAVFGDALRRLTDRTTHLYVDKSRYWFSTQPGVTRLAQDRASLYDIHDVWEELKRRLRDDRRRGDLAGVHIAPAGSEEVPDEKTVRLVVLGPESPHSSNPADSPARRQVQELFERRGSASRYYRNMLVFLAPDRARLGDLEQAVRQYLAWESIVKEREVLNLDVFQTNLATTKAKQADESVAVRIEETFVWLLVPSQPDPRGPVEWEEIRLQGPGPLAERASRKLVNDELLVTRFAGTRLRLTLDTHIWRGRSHVGLRQLWEDLASYVYLPRLRDVDVLVRAVEDGLALTSWPTETFAYADGRDEATGRYLGLRAGQLVSAILDTQSLLVKPEAALRQMEEEARGRVGSGAVPGGSGGPDAGPASGSGFEQAAGGAAGDLGPAGTGSETGREVGPLSGPEGGPTLPRRFYGQATLDPLRVGLAASTIADEIIRHLAALEGAEVEVTLEIKAVVPAGVPAKTARDVAENCKTLKLKAFGFEDA